MSALSPETVNFISPAILAFKITRKLKKLSDFRRKLSKLFEKLLASLTLTGRQQLFWGKLEDWLSNLMSENNL